MKKEEVTGFFLFGSSSISSHFFIRNKLKVDKPVWILYHGEGEKATRL